MPNLNTTPRVAQNRLRPQPSDHMPVHGTGCNTVPPENKMKAKERTASASDPGSGIASDLSRSLPIRPRLKMQQKAAHSPCLASAHGGGESGNKHTKPAHQTSFGEAFSLGVWSCSLDSGLMFLMNDDWGWVKSDRMPLALFEFMASGAS